jgi:hypothetical protein
MTPEQLGVESRMQAFVAEDDREEAEQYYGPSTYDDLAWSRAHACEQAKRWLRYVAMCDELASERHGVAKVET